MNDQRIDRAVGLCKKLVSSFSYSWKRKREFLAAQKEMKLPSNKVGIMSGHNRENHRAAKGHCTCPVLLQEVLLSYPNMAGHVAPSS